MKKSWKNRSGVSPVIATILMVAITVVLAAVLYVMVMGFGGTSGQKPTVSMTKSTTATAHEEKVLISSISEAQLYANMKVSIAINSTVFNGQVKSGLVTLAGNATAEFALDGVTFVDVAGDGKVSAGDYFIVETLKSNTPVTLSLLYGADASSIGSSEWTSN